MQPIPRQLLIHSAELYNVTTDRWQEETATLVASLSYVRIEPSSKVVLSKDNKEQRLSATLFYDCISSSPRNIAFTEGQKIDAFQKTYHVVSVDMLYDKLKLHHLEVGLV